MQDVDATVEDIATTAPIVEEEDDDVCDMPRLNDSRRVARICLVLDELRKAARDDTWKEALSRDEFRLCGGVGHAEQYSFYRQLVYAKRDMQAFVRLKAFPPGATLTKCDQLFVFHDTDDEELVEEDAKSSSQSQHKMRRIERVLVLCRNTYRQRSTSVRTTRMSDCEFVACGGMKSVLKRKARTATFSLYRQLVLATRDLRGIVRARRFPCVKDLSGASVHKDPFSDDEEENVDRMDDNERVYHDDDEHVVDAFDEPCDEDDTPCSPLKEEEEE